MLTLSKVGMYHHWCIVGCGVQFHGSCSKWLVSDNHEPYDPLICIAHIRWHNTRHSADPKYSRNLIRNVSRDLFYRELDSWFHDQNRLHSDFGRCFHHFLLLGFPVQIQGWHLLIPHACKHSIRSIDLKDLDIIRERHIGTEKINFTRITRPVITFGFHSNANSSWNSQFPLKNQSLSIN